MTTTFDYALAWKERVLPAVDELDADIRALFERVWKECEGIFQQNGRTAMPWPEEMKGVEDRSLHDEFLNLATSTPLMLAEACSLINVWGHWGSGIAAASSGATWKFENYGKQALVEVKAESSVIKQAGRHPWEGDPEFDHRYNTNDYIKKTRELIEYAESAALVDGGIADYPKIESPDKVKGVVDQDSAAYYLGTLLHIEYKTDPPINTLKVKDVNHRVREGVFMPKGGDRNGPFTIGSRHIALSKGMYLDPTVAPCVRTGCNYEDFEYDTVCFIQLTRNVENSEFVKVVKFLEPHFDTMGIDGLTTVETLERYRVAEPLDKPE